ncbi:MAG: hypothetical protein AABY22_12165, partial [Nanoarchaeota archaeon]
MENKTIIGLAIIILALLLGNYLGFFSLFGLDYSFQQNATLLNYNALLFSDTAFGTTSWHIPNPSSDALPYFDAYITNNQGSMSIGYGQHGDRYLTPTSFTNGLITTNAFLDFNKIESIDLIVKRYESFMCRDDVNAGGGSASVLL